MTQFTRPSASKSRSRFVPSAQGAPSDSHSGGRTEPPDEELAIHVSLPNLRQPNRSTSASPTHRGDTRCAGVPVWLAVAVVPVTAASVALGTGVAFADDLDVATTAGDLLLRPAQTPVAAGAAPTAIEVNAAGPPMDRHRPDRRHPHRSDDAKKSPRSSAEGRRETLDGRSTSRPSRGAARTSVRRAHVRLAPSSAVETRRTAARSRFNDPGYCLEWSRQQADIPARYPDAATAWTHATGKRRGDRTPPAGAAVYWTGGSQGYGHVAISVGGGKVRSSDAGGAGRVSTVPVKWITREWGLKYAGWADSINGYTIRGVGKA